MPAAIPGLMAATHLPGSLASCSWQAGWRSLLLREYAEPAASGMFRTPACRDHLVVLVLEGPCQVRGRYLGRWQEACYGIGSMGMTRPGEEVELAFRGEVPGRTLQLHLPGSLLRRVASELGGPRSGELDLPHQLCLDDPFMRQAMLSLRGALEIGTPALYADVAAEMLATHLLVRQGRQVPRASVRDQLRLQRADAFLRENLGAQVSLDDLAGVVGVSGFHLIRMFRNSYGETPYRRLTRLRMEAAQERLRGTGEAITEIALSLGYANPAHFAAAFRRVVGVAPSAYRARFR